MPSVWTANQADVETVREIIMLTSFEETQGLLEALNDAQKTVTIQDCVEWRKVRYSATDTYPTADSPIEIQKARKRRLIRHNVRIRLGLDGTADEEDESELAAGGASKLESGVVRFQTGRSFEAEAEASP